MFLLLMQGLHTPIHTDLMLSPLYDDDQTGWLSPFFTLNYDHLSSCDINLVSATQWGLFFFIFLMASNWIAHFFLTRSQFEICMKNGRVSWWNGSAIKRQTIEIEILESSCSTGSDGSHAIKKKHILENNGGLVSCC